MRGNRYLAKLISDYNTYKKFSKTTRLFSSEEEIRKLTSEIDPDLLQEYVSVFEERYERMGIDPTKLPDDVLYKDMALVSLVASGKCDPRRGYDKCKDLVDEIVEKAKSVSYSRMHKSFSIMKIADSVWGRIGKRLALGGVMVHTLMAKVLKSKEPGETMENVVNNRAVAVSVANPDLSYYRTGKDVPKDEKQLIDIISKERGKELSYAYTVVYGAAGKLPEAKEALDKLPKAKVEETEATRKIYKSVKKIYDYLIKHAQDRALYIKGLTPREVEGDKPLNMIVGNEYISQDDILNFLSMMMASNVINKLYTHGGAFDITFLDHDGNKTNEVTSTIYLVTKDGQVHYVIELDEIRLADMNNPKIKDGVSIVDNRAMVHFYIQFPVDLEKSSVGGIFAPMFEVVARVTIVKSVSDTSHTAAQSGVSNRHLKNKRLFSKKKKYDWM